MNLGKIETGTQIDIYTPNIEYFGSRKEIAKPFPTDFRQRFRKLSKGIYPQEPIQKMLSDTYNPLIIGYSHANTSELEAIQRKLEQLKQQNSKESFRVLQEIDPQQLEWIRQFLQAENEYKEKGTVNGIPCRVDELQRMQDYRRRLQSNNAESLSLWYLENGIDVKPIEHPDVKKWIEEDRSKEVSLDEEDFGFELGQNLRPIYTAIRRDIHGLQMIDQERPDVISVGAMHALKYDMLMNRDGKNSFYYLDGPFDWEIILKHWENMHKQYARQH